MKNGHKGKDANEEGGGREEGEGEGRRGGVRMPAWEGLGRKEMKES